jgi:hypothetical protein
MKEQWYIVLDESDNAWTWCVLRDRELTWSEHTFARYPESYEDAARHGCFGIPALATIASPRLTLH